MEGIIKIKTKSGTPTEADELKVVLKDWAKKNDTSLDFNKSGGKIIIHFDQDDNIRLVEVHKVLLKT